MSANESRVSSGPRVALVYDFDGTLVQGNIQEHSFIPAIGMQHDEFWSKVKKLARDHDSDEILAYMYLMLEEARKSKEPVSEDRLRQHGRDLPLFPGLENGTWFGRLNRYAGKLNLCLDHYVVSSGIQEMIQGCSIFDEFRHVFASRFIYVAGKARWPAVAINYTTKTQYVYRINKGIDNHCDNDMINAYIPEHKRAVPFERMIYIGDGYTDIPAMKMVASKGGHSIAVYDPKTNNGGREIISKLISDDRVNFVAPADYERDSQLDIIVKGVLGRIAARSANVHAYQQACE